MHKQHLLTKRLEQLRENNNWNKSKAANILQLHKTTYTSYENGVYEPNIDGLRQIAEFYDTSIDYLVGHEIKKNDYIIPYDINSIKEAYDFIDNLRCLLKDKTEEEIIKFVNSLLHLSRK